MSIAMDNIFSGNDKPTGTSKIRHLAELNYCFVDGHAHIIRMAVGNYPGYGTVAVPQNKNDGLDWCYDPNALPASTWGGPSGYPLSSVETCANAVNDIYSHATITP